MISLTLWKILDLFADDATLYHDISHPSERQAAASTLSSDLDKITNWSNTLNMSLNSEKSHTITRSISPKCKLSHPLSQRLSQSGSVSQTLGSFSQLWSLWGKPHFKVGLRSHMLTGHASLLKILPWHTPIQSSYPATRLSSAAWWSTALLSELAPLPHTLFSLTSWKRRLSGSVIAMPPWPRPRSVNSRLSPVVPFVMLCSDLFCVQALPRASTTD